MLKNLLTCLLLILGTTALFSQVTPPKFPGGDKGFYKFCSTYFTFSEDILKEHITEEIPVSIYISRKGVVDSVEFPVEGRPEIMKQLKTMFANIPDFKPAKRGKDKISSQFNVIVKISLPTADNEK